VERDDEPSVLPGWSVAPLTDFGAAVRGVLEHLSSTLPLPTWVFVRVDGDKGLVLGAAGEERPEPGSTFHWAESLSAHMVRQGCRVATSVPDLDAYQDVPVVRAGQVGAYLGVPVCRADGTLFGALVGASPVPVPEDLAEHLPVVELLGRLLGGLLAADLRAAVRAREVQRVQVQEMYDPVTGLGDRRYWDQVVAAEESRCRRYGDHAAVIVLELEDYDAIGEQDADATQVLLRRAARVLRTHCREEDLVARVAPSMFAILSVGADADGAAALVERLQVALAENVAATLRYQARDPRRGLIEAWSGFDAEVPVGHRRPA
jgi:diguanylate cyclase